MERKCSRAITIVSFWAALAISGCNSDFSAAKKSAPGAATDSSSNAGEICDEAMVPFGGGVGTVDSKYLICTEEQFDFIRTQPDKHFKLMDDLDFNGSPTNLFEKISGFTGTLDGNYHTIKDLYIHASGSVGIFDSSYASGFSVKNLTVDGAHIQNVSNGGYMAGVIVGYAGGGSVIENIVVKNSYIGGGYYGAIGLIAGYIENGTVVKDSTVINSTAIGQMSRVALGVGEISSTYIDNVMVQGMVVSSTNIWDGDAGAIAGRVTGQDPAHGIFNSFADATVIGNSISNQGIPGLGLIAGEFTNATMSKVFATGIVVADGEQTNNVGGAIGRTDWGTTTLDDVYVASSGVFVYDPNPPATPQIHGFLGYDTGGGVTTITDSYYSNHAEIPSEAFPGITAIPLASLSTQGLFAGFDFTNIWQYVIGIGFSAPMLRSMGGANPFIELGMSVPDVTMVSGMLSLTETYDPVSGYSFPDTTVGTTNTQTITVINQGTVNAVIDSVTMANNNTFTINGGMTTCTNGLVLAPTVGCAIGVNFTPSIQERDADSVIVGFTQSGRSLKTGHVVSGTGLESNVLLASNVITFSASTENSSQSRNVNIQNLGAVTATIDAVQYAIGTNFSVTTDNCSGQTLPQWGSCTLTVLFSGNGTTVSGTLGDILKINYTDTFMNTGVARYTHITTVYQNAFASGAGTDANPFIVNNYAQFINVKNFATGGYTFSQNANIDLTGTGCNSYTGASAFSGKYYGNGNTLSNWCRSFAADIALFGMVNGIIQDLVVDGFTLTRTGGGTNRNVGGISIRTGVAAQFTNVTVKNSTITGGTNDTVGGIASWIIAATHTGNHIENSVITGDLYTGGIAGRVSGSAQITDSDVNSSTEVHTISSGYVGGIAGYIMQSSRITNCSSAAAVKSDPGSYANGMGGIVGVLSGSNIISNSFSTGTITVAPGFNATAVGGFIGFMNGAGGAGATISNSYATGNVDADGAEFVGGFVGNVGSLVSYINDSYATGNVTGTGLVGGFAGGGEDIYGLFQYCQNGVLTRTYALGNVTGGNYVGGHSGCNTNTIIDSYYGAGTVNATLDYAGGFVYGNFGTITNAYSMATSVNAVNSTHGGFIYDHAAGTLTGTLFYDNGSLPADTSGASRFTNPTDMTDPMNYLFDFGTPIWRFPGTNPSLPILSPVLNYQCGVNGVSC